MKSFPFICAALLCAVPAVAQPVFSSSSLPGNVGQYVRAYYSTNVNVASMLALTKGAQNWDFSQPQQPYETVQRTDIVSPDDAGDEGSFPDAVYAERDTLEPANQIAWRYDSLTNQGRYYYGLDNPLDVDGPPVAVFNQPTLDIPATVQYSQTWNRTVNWTGLFLEIIPTITYFSDSSTVDAYGTLTLPSIGAAPALRVHEVHAYETDWIGVGPVDIHTNQYYYWLVPGLGVAAQVYLFGDNVLAPGSLDHTNAVLRVFASNYFTNQTAIIPAAGLHISLQNNSVLLNWNAITNASEYQVEFLGSLNNTNWQLLGLPATNAWSDAVTSTQKFYRVFGLQ
jgi:hypothetical protein